MAWVGTYERDYPRNRVLIEGLRQRGVTVREHHRPVWESAEHKAGLAPRALVGMAGRAGLGWARVAAEVARGGPLDVVVAGYPAQPDAVPAWLVARARRAVLVADMMISLADTLAGDRAVAGRRMGRLLAGLDRTALRLADLVLCDTRAHAEFFHGRFGVPRTKLVVAAVGAEPAHFPPAPPEAAATPPHVLFYGKLSPLHGLETVLEAARVAGVPPVHIVGDGQQGPWLAEQLAADRPPGMEWERWVPYPQLAARIARSAVCLGVFGRSEKAARVVPNKVWQAMAVGRPVVTADTPGVREVLVHGESALLVPPGDARALAGALRLLAGDPELRLRLGAGARTAYERRGAPAAAAAPLHDALREAVAARRGRR